MTKKAKKGLINLLPFQETVFWDQRRMLFMVWRRQAGKSHTFGSKALSRCILRRDHLVCYASGSILMGGEIILKEAQLWGKLIDHFRIAAKTAGLQLTSNADDDKGNTLDINAVADLFENSKLECKIWHDNTSFSRTRVLSPNPATARGFSGDVFGDEIGFWPDYKATLDAVEPIVSRNREWLLWLATTPPKDDTHPTYELLLPDQESFPVNRHGNWYETQSDSGRGFPVHRVDAYDAEKAGLPIYSLMTGEPISVGEARLEAIDRESFDRNYLLKFIAGGAAALSLTDIVKAQMRGASLGLSNRVFESITLT